MCKNAVMVGNELQSQSDKLNYYFLSDTYTQIDQIRKE